MYAFTKSANLQDYSLSDMALHGVCDVDLSISVSFEVGVLDRKGKKIMKNIN